MLTEDEQLTQAFNRGKEAFAQKQSDDAAIQAAFEKYHPAAGKGAAINKGSATRDVSPGAALGSVVGGVAGGALTAQTGGWGAILGAVMGAAVGEFGQQVYDKATNSAYAPVDAAESATRIAKEAAFSAIGEGAGRAITFVRPVAYAKPATLSAEQLKTKAFMDRHQIPYTPDQITGSSFHSFLRSVADNGIFSETAMQTFYKDQNAAIRGVITDIADTMGQHVPIDKLGVEVANYATGRSKLIQDTIVAPLYKRIDQDLAYTTQTIQVPTGKMVPHPSGLMGPNGQPLMVPEMADKTVTQGGLLVDIRPLKAKFQTQVAALEKDAINMGDKNFAKLRDTNPAYETMKDFLSTEDQIQWNAAHTLLKSTREKLRRADDVFDPASSKLYDKGKLIEGESLLDKQMGVALQQSSNPAHQADYALWRQAQAITKGRAEQFKNETVMRLVKSIDERGGSKGVAQFENNMTAEDMAEVWKAVRSNPDLQGSMRRAYLEDKIIKAGGMADAEAPFDAEKFRKALFGKDEAAALKSNVVLDARQKQKLTEFINAVSDVQGENVAGKFGSVFIRMKSSGALFSVPLALYGASQIGGGDVKEGVAELAGAASILIAPNVLARLLTNPRATEYMIQGLRYSATDHSQALRITRELMRLDQGFAQAVRTGLSMNEAVPGGGPITRTAETVKKGVMETIPSIFGNQQ